MALRQNFFAVRPLSHIGRNDRDVTITKRWLGQDLGRGGLTGSKDTPKLAWTATKTYSASCNKFGACPALDFHASHGGPCRGSSRRSHGTRSRHFLTADSES